MTYITFSFDTEDYVNPIGAEAVLRTAEILRKRNVRGCYNIVAKMAEAFKKWGREDVIEALHFHEIENHSLAHSHHPTINECTDIEDFYEAKRIFLEQETEAVQKIKEIMGCDTLHAACPPGNSTSYVAHYGYAEMGFKCYDGDELFDEALHRPISCCNLLCLNYVVSFVEELAEKSEEELLAYIDEMAQTDYIIVCNHPQLFYLTRFWDGMNFKGKNTPKEEWVAAPRRDPEKTEAYFKKLEFFVDALQRDERFCFVTYEDIAEIYGDKGRVITKETLAEIEEQLRDSFFPVTLPDSYCLSDVMLACRDLLLGKAEHECGKVYGFLNTPYSIDRATMVTAEEISEAAGQIGDGFLPEKIHLGEKVIGPADWLRGALRVIAGEKTVSLSPADWQIDLNQFPYFRDLKYKNTWLHAEDFEDRYLSHRFRLQSWTIRLPKSTKRMIF